ncbi:helix-turn-helix domain-containing protein [Xanthomonas vasicola]|nr:helix-turn-helix transcriptional regulator [Xanthomonas vasicola]MDO6950017.1 helix-turn-helix transcriptional regulator [Xanthomonas vasicola]MDO6962068.1 helix-turn-helix transcriptional regulator [Xanthomonas vasicola]MDO6970944.1 helix-turn-helix transcriptional regulator [Xanthomonas vasicola]
MRSTNHSFNESLPAARLTFMLVGMSVRPPELLRLFATRLKARRQAMGLTQQDLGEALGLEGRIAQSRISRYEIELHTPDLKTAYELAEVLGVSLSALVAESDRLGQIIELIRKLSDDEQEALAKRLRQLTKPKRPRRPKTEG